jgi:hypothetical protein
MDRQADESLQKTLPSDLFYGGIAVFPPDKKQRVTDII